MINRETQTGMLSHFQKKFKNRSGFALRRNAWHTNQKKKDIAAMIKKKNT
jgi:hypothetical protein